MQISEAANGAPAAGAEPCRFPKLEECAHFHYERVQLPQLTVTLQTNMDQSLHSQHTNDEETEWFMVQVTSGDECWLLQRNFENFQMLDDQLHQCIYDRKISQLPDLSSLTSSTDDLESTLIEYLERFSSIADNSVNCGPVLNWLQMDNKGHRLLVPSEESRSINTPAVAAAYSVRRYVSQARDELNLEVGDMISVIDMASPGESMWWRGKRGFQVGFFPQHCVHIIGDKVPRNMPLPPPVVGSLALTPIKPVLRKHGKLITFFRSFILNRPSRRRLKQSGILKERVFGCDLGEHLLNSGHDIPMVLKCCAEFIESHGIVDGIYRLSGVTSNIQKLRNAFDEDRIPNLYTEDILQDIHSVASLLKMYFRELPNPLCTYQLYQSFVNAVQGSNTSNNSDLNHKRLLKMREAVQKLPPPHYRTLEYLTKHLAKVANHGTRTGMTTRNIAIVWAPNLLRCEALEIGGVAALQGVGVQAVVTEFLICYADLIFCDHLPNLDVPLLTSDVNLLAKKCRPNSLAISTPTKLITLEEARSKHLPNKLEDSNNYIEVGGGPKNLPKKYHTVIELPSGARKRNHTKRSPLGWRSLFSKSRNTNQNNLPKNRKASTPITINEKSVTESDLTDMKRKLRTVKSAESLTSGHSEPASNEDVLGPLHSLNKPPGHNRSVSHDSYFDTLQNSQNNSEGSLLDLSEIQLNFELEESEMRIFSEDESLVSSPRIQKDSQRRILTRARPEDLNSATNSVNPSPKKQARVVLSPDSMSRKRTRLEDQLSDIQYIDCNTPENVVSTTALIHTVPDSPHLQVKEFNESYQPKNKSPRNSENIDKRQSLNFEPTPKPIISKSFTEMDLDRKFMGGVSVLTTPTPQSPVYKQLCDSSSNSTPALSPEQQISYQQLNNKKEKPSPNYENILTTISITYKSPPRSLATSPLKSPDSANYENVILNPEKVVIPTSTASLPIQEASQPEIQLKEPEKEERPKSLSALEDYNNSSETATLKANLSSSAICNTSEQLSLPSLQDQKTMSSNQSSGSNIQYTPSLSSAPYHFIENSEQLSPTDLSLSEIVHSSTDNLSTSHTSISFPLSPSKISPIVSPTTAYDGSTQDLLTPTENRNTSEDGLSNDENLSSVDGNLPKRPASVNLIDFSPLDEKQTSMNEKRKSSETETTDDNAIYQQVKYFRRSIHEVNALLDLNQDKEENNYDSLEPDVTHHVYENVDGSSLRSDNVYENVEINKTECCDIVIPEKMNVRQLTSKFEEKEAVSLPTNVNKQSYENNDDDAVLVNKSLNNESTNCRLKKFYEKDSLPPCLRARNLKYQLKTRSLDEDEFQKECGSNNGDSQRRPSLDECVGYKTNSLPKKLNQPKALPMDDGKVDSIHLAHSNENIAHALEEEQKKRERIEKYKEERRKFLHDKYRSESFKEDKDVLLSRLRIFKTKDDPKLEINEQENVMTRYRRKSSRSDDSGNDVAADSLEEDNSQNLKLVQNTLNQTSSSSSSSSSGLKKETNNKPMVDSLKCRAAIFELNQRVHTTDLNRNNNRSSTNETKQQQQQQTEKNYAKIVQDNKYGRRVQDNKKTNDDDVDFIRNKRREGSLMKEEKRRHTFETRERESETERLRRLSLENRSPRKEKTSPSYCIKDVKAIFESKSKQ